MNAIVDYPQNRFGLTVRNIHTRRPPLQLYWLFERTPETDEARRMVGFPLSEDTIKRLFEARVGYYTDRDCVLHQNAGEHHRVIVRQMDGTFLAEIFYVECVE